MIRYRITMSVLRSRVRNAVIIQWTLETRIDNVLLLYFLLNLFYEHHYNQFKFVLNENFEKKSTYVDIRDGARGEIGAVAS